MAVATTNILTDVGDAIKSFRKENGAEFTNYMLATICRDKTIRREHAGVNGPKLNGVVEGGQTRSDEGRRHSRLPWAPPTFNNFHDPDRFWVETDIYMTGCLNTTATVANAGCNSPCEAWFGYRRSIPSRLCNSDFSALNAPTSRSPMLNGAPTPAGGVATRGIPSRSSYQPV